MRSTTVAIACATLCAAWCASAAHADIVHFVNPAPGEPGHFAWYGGGQHPRYLNITTPAAEQANVSTGRSVAQIILGLPTGGIWGQLGLFEGGGPDFARIAGVVIPPYDNHEVLPLQHGDPLTGLNFLGYGLYAWGFPPFTTSAFPEGSRRYIGVLTGDGLRGWIEVERTGLNFNAVAWAYQSDPGAPILAGQVPAPGAAVLMAAGGVALASRRRRS